MTGYKVYMVGVDSNDSKIVGTLKDLEEDFKGLVYLKATGINDIGEAKNVYVETYSDSQVDRVYIPDVIANSSTDIKLELIFIGANRHNVFDEFNEYIRHGRHQFWDSERKKAFTFYVQKDIKPSEENFKNGQPYLKAVYPLKNISGYAIKKESI